MTNEQIQNQCDKLASELRDLFTPGFEELAKTGEIFKIMKEIKDTVNEKIGVK